MTMNNDNYKMNNEQFEMLPEDVQIDVKDILRVYDKAYVDFYNGDYHASACFGIYASYPKDHRTVGVYTAKEIFTEDERTVNYVNSFRAYPIWYKGKRDYDLLKTLANSNVIIDMKTGTCKCLVAGLVNGNIEIVGEKTFTI